MRYSIALALCLLSVVAWAEDQKPVRILFLSKSSGFIHSVIHSKDGSPSLVDTVLTKLAQEMGATLTTTKDAGLINAENLKNYDVVIFYTTGKLTEPGSDKQPPMAEKGVDELLAWIRNGGGFIGFHCANDTFHADPPCSSPTTPFLQMLGGEFAGHGKQFAGKLIVTDPQHPTMANLPNEWTVHEEWYTHCNLDRENIHVLALLDPGAEREKQAMYNVPNYPAIWCKAYGKGRVYYNSMGHREDVWENPTFQSVVRDAIRWCAGHGELKAEPNFDKVVPSDTASKK